MRFRLFLPTAQTILMLVIMWAPWAPRAHEVYNVFRDGRETNTWTLLPGPYAVDWALGLNLPADAIVTPAEFALRKPGAPPNHKVIFFGLWFVGFACWYMVGRLAEDLLSWRRDGVLPPRHTLDIAFALLAAPSAALLGSVFFFGADSAPTMFAWAAVWVTITGVALLFRFLQFFRETFKPPVP